MFHDPVRLLLAAAALAALSAAASAQSRPHRGLDIAADCAPCHGDDGIAKDRDVPHLAGQNEGYLYNQLKAFQSGRRPHKEMRFLARPLTEAEIRLLAEYYASLPAR
jgi:cytochrome c553